MEYDLVRYIGNQLTSQLLTSIDTLVVGVWIGFPWKKTQGISEYQVVLIRTSQVPKVLMGGLDVFFTKVCLSCGCDSTPKSFGIFPNFPSKKRWLNLIQDDEHIISIVHQSFRRLASYSNHSFWASILWIAGFVASFFGKGCTFGAEDEKVCFSIWGASNGHVIREHVHRTRASNGGLCMSQWCPKRHEQDGCSFHQEVKFARGVFCIHMCPLSLLNLGNPNRNGIEHVESRLFLDISNSTFPKDSFTKCFVGAGELNINL